MESGNVKVVPKAADEPTEYCRFCDKKKWVALRTSICHYLNRIHKASNAHLLISKPKPEALNPSWRIVAKAGKHPGVIFTSYKQSLEEALTEVLAVINILNPESVVNQLEEQRIKHEKELQELKCELNLVSQELKMSDDIFYIQLEKNYRQALEANGEDAPETKHWKKMIEEWKDYMVFRHTTRPVTVFEAFDIQTTLDLANAATADVARLAAERELVLKDQIKRMDAELLSQAEALGKRGGLLAEQNEMSKVLTDTLNKLRAIPTETGSPAYNFVEIPKNMDIFTEGVKVMDNGIITDVYLKASNESKIITSLQAIVKKQNTLIADLIRKSENLYKLLAKMDKMDILASINSDLQKLTKEKDILTMKAKRIEDLKTQESKLQYKNTVLEAKIAKLQVFHNEEVAGFIATIEGLQNENKRVLEDQGEWTKKIDAKNGNIDEKNAKIEDLDMNIGLIKKELLNKVGTINNLHNINIVSENQKSKLRHYNEPLQEDNIALNNLKHTLLNDNNNLKNWNIKLSKKENGLKQRNKDLESLYTTQIYQTDVLRTKKETIANYLVELGSNMNLLKVTVDDKNKLEELAADKNELEKLCKQKHELLEREFKQVKLIEGQLKGDNRQLALENAKLRTTLGVRYNEVHELKQQRAEVEAEVEKIEVEIDTALGQLIEGAKRVDEIKKKDEDEIKQLRVLWKLEEEELNVELEKKLLELNGYDLVIAEEKEVFEHQICEEIKGTNTKEDDNEEDFELV